MSWTAFIAATKNDLPLALYLTAPTLPTEQMPLRIAIVASITIAACLVVPVTVNAVSSPGGEDSLAENAEDPDPGDSAPIQGPIGVTPAGDHTMGVYIPTVGSRTQTSGTGLLAVIVAFLLPSLYMIVRSNRRRRAGPVDTE